MAKRRVTNVERWNKYMDNVVNRRYATRGSARKAYSKLMAADKPEGLRLLNFWYPTKALEAAAQQTTLAIQDNSPTRIYVASNEDDDHIEIEAQFFLFDEGAPIRVVEFEGAEWFIAQDVCRALDISNTRDAVTRLDEDVKRVVPVGSTDGKRGPRNINVINRSGVYDLIVTSRKPEAKRFRRWITDVVIPALETGKWVRARKEEEKAKEQLPAKEEHLFEYVKYENGVPAVSFIVRGERREDKLISLAQQALFGHLAAEPPMDISLVQQPYHLYSVHPGAPLGHYPAAILFSKLLMPDAQHAWTDAQSMTMLSLFMLKMYAETYGSTDNVRRTYGVVQGISADGQTIDVDHAHYNVETIWGVFVATLFKLRYTFREAWFRDLKLELTTLGRHAQDSFTRRSLLPMSDPEFVLMPKYFLQAQAHLSRQDWVLR